MRAQPAGRAGEDGAPLVAVTGEWDVNSALAQLANARYASESVGSGTGTTPPPREGGETLTVLTSLAEVRAAVNEIAATAQRRITIYTPDLEPDLYDQTACLEVIKHFVLTRSFSKVRVLLAEPTRVMRDSNRFVAMGKRLSSCIDIRYAAADINNQVMARLYLQEFDQVWNASEVERGLRTRTARRG